MIMEAGKSKICRVTQQIGVRGEQMLKFKSEDHLLQSFLLFERGQSLVPFRPSPDWMRPTMLWRSICFALSPQI